MLLRLASAALRGVGLAGEGLAGLAGAALAILLALGAATGVASLLALTAGTVHAATAEASASGARAAPTATPAGDVPLAREANSAFSAAQEPEAHAATPSSPASGLDRLMALLARRKHGEVSFTERDTLSILSRPLESSGVLIYDAPDHLVKRTLRPKRESLALDGDVVTVRRGGRALHFDLDSYPQAAPYVDAIRATLAGDRAALERVFHVEFEGSLDHWRLALTPRQTRMAKSVRRIRITGARDDIRRIEILERNGDRSLMTLGSPSAP